MNTQGTNNIKLPRTANLKISAIPVAFVLMWSSGAIFVELGLRYSDPFIFLLLRLLFSTLILWGIVFHLKTPLPATSKEWRHILLTGLCMQSGYQIFFFLALSYSISPGILTIILGAQPIITAIFMKENNQWIGLFLGVIGLVLVVADSLFVSSITIIGIVIALLSLSCITIGTILQKKITINQPSNMAIQYSGGTMVLLFLVAIFDQTLNWTPLFAFSLAWMTIIISVGATLLLYYMIGKGNLTSVTSLFYCVPPVTALVDYFVFGNRLNLLAILGMVFIIGGLIMINRRGKFL